MVTSKPETAMLRGTKRVAEEGALENERVSKRANRAEQGRLTFGKWVEVLVRVAHVYTV